MTTLCIGPHRSQSLEIRDLCNQERFGANRASGEVAYARRLGTQAVELTPKYSCRCGSRRIGPSSIRDAGELPEMRERLND